MTCINRKLLIQAFIAISITVSFYYLVKPTCLPQANGDTQAFYYFTLESQAQQALTGSQIAPWKKRVAGPLLTGWLTDCVSTSITELNQKHEQFQQVFAGYHALWLLALFVAFIKFTPQQSVFLILGTFAGLMYYRSDPVPLYLSWDMPTLFFFTLAYLAYKAEKLGTMIAAILAGATFKESNLLPAILILFYQSWTMKKRAIVFSSIVGAVVILLASLSLGLATDTQLTSMSATGWNVLIWQNLKELFGPHLRQVLFVNCGTLVLLLALPSDLATKALVVAFIAGQLLFGTFHEFRIWYEVLPIGMMVVGRNLNAPSRESE